MVFISLDDNILIFMVNPETSAPALIDTINRIDFFFSGNRIHFSKSGAMPLGGIQRYQLSVHLCFISDRVYKGIRFVWFDIKSSLRKFPLINVKFSQEI